MTEDMVDRLGWSCRWRERLKTWRALAWRKLVFGLVELVNQLKEKDCEAQCLGMCIGGMVGVWCSRDLLSYRQVRDGLC